MVTRKKILAFAMLLLVAAPLFFFPVFLIRQTLHRYQMEERLENTHLQTITINLKDVNWVKEKKEVIIDGNLFDIKSYVITGDIIELTGLYDTDEDELKKELSRVLHGKMDGSAPVHQLVLKFIFTPVIINAQTPVKSSLFISIPAGYQVYDEILVCQPPCVNTPPPNI